MADNPFGRDLGPCVVDFDGVEIGESVGGVKHRDSMETATSMRDRYGDDPYDEIVVASNLEIEADFAFDTLEQLAKVYPGAVLSAGPATKSLTLKTPVGYSLRTNAKVLILKPIVDGEATTDETQWMTIPLAHPVPKFDRNMSLKDQSVWKVIFKTYPNKTTRVKAVLGKDAAV